MSDGYIAAWDIGGSHLKLALLARADKRVVTVRQWAMPLWQGLEAFSKVFSAALEEATQGLASANVRHVASMTAELSDIFPDREQGVQAMLGQLRQLGIMDGPAIYCRTGLARMEELRGDREKLLQAASANWHATLSYVASLQGDGMLIDIGGTTTDILPFAHGKPATTGVTDHERLASGELVYSGVVRTPVAMVCNSVPWRGRALRLCSERFADMADVYRLLGQLSPRQDLHATADNRGKDPEQTRNRLARMIGMDSIGGEEALGLARFLAESQLRLIDDALMQVLSNGACDKTSLVAAGAGSFMVHELARRHGTGCVDVSSLCGADDAMRDAINDCASAVALAHVAAAGQADA